MARVRRSYPRFRREGEAPPIALTDDDIAILEHVYRHRFVRADDLYRLFPGRSADRLSRRLVRLFRNRYLDRPIAQVDRFREGGSSALVYGLDTAGARYLKEHRGLDVASVGWKARNRSYTRSNLDHTLAVAQFMVDLEIACAARGDIELITLEEILVARPKDTKRGPRFEGWPVPLRYAGASATVQLVPDAVFGLRATQPDGHKVRSFTFVEIDRGTMTIAPAKRVREGEGFLHRSSVLRKFLTYAASHERALHREHLGIPIARVLTLTASAARVEAMRLAAMEHVVKPQRLPAGLFLFGAHELGADLLTRTWLTADGKPMTFDLSSGKQAEGQ